MTSTAQAPGSVCTIMGKKSGPTSQKCQFGSLSLPIMYLNKGSVFEYLAVKSTVPLTSKDHNLYQPGSSTIKVLRSRTQSKMNSLVTGAEANSGLSKRQLQPGQSPAMDRKFEGWSVPYLRKNARPSRRFSRNLGRNLSDITCCQCLTCDIVQIPYLSHSSGAKVAELVLRGETLQADELSDRGIANICMPVGGEHTFIETSAGNGPLANYERPSLTIWSVPSKRASTRRSAKYGNIFQKAHESMFSTHI